jgi:hypothetical protein
MLQMMSRRNDVGVDRLYSHSDSVLLHSEPVGAD